MAEAYNDLLDRLHHDTGLSAWSEENEKAILEPYTYITSTPGKEIRGRMIEAFNHWLKVEPRKLEIIGRVVRMLHSASLLVDDVEDDSHLRRGVPVAHKIYGIPQAINSANYVYFLAFKELHALETPPSSPLSIDQIVNGELLNLHRGQGLELLWRDNLQCPTEEEYIGMVNNKTGGLFRIAIKLLISQASVPPSTDLIPLVNLLGILFQIRDDYMNLQSTTYATNKSFAEDLTEGKFSFPLIHSIRSSASSSSVVRNVLQKRPTSPTLKKYVIEFMDRETASFEYTRDVLLRLEKQAREEIARMGGNEALERILDMLSVKNAE